MLLSPNTIYSCGLYLGRINLDLERIILDVGIRIILYVGSEILEIENKFIQSCNAKLFILDRWLEKIFILE